MRISALACLTLLAGCAFYQDRSDRLVRAALSLANVYCERSAGFRAQVRHRFVWPSSGKPAVRIHCENR